MTYREVSALDPDGSTPILLLLILIVLHAFFAAAEQSFTTLRTSRPSSPLGDGNNTSRLVSALSENTTRLLTTTQFVLKLIAFLLVAFSISAFAEPVAGWLSGLGTNWSPATAHTLSVILIALTLTLAVILFGEITPRSLATRRPESFARLAAYPISLVSVITLPLAKGLAAVSHGLSGTYPGSPDGSAQFVTEEQIKTMVDAGEEEGVLEEEEKEMIYSIFELGDTLAREVMVPRIDMVAIDVNTSVEEAMGVIVQAGHSRIPVYQEHIDNVVGILYAKDLLKFWADLPRLKVSEFLRPAYFIPETKKVDELLQELQQRKVHIAMVVDEYGGTAGLVTIEDILEEIVGEIQDEYDTEEAVMEVIGPHEVIFDGRVDLDDVNHTMGINLPTDDADTVGGLIYTSLGRVPVAGDRVKFDDVELTVLSVAGRRVKKVRAERLIGEPELDTDNGHSWFDSVVNGVTRPGSDKNVLEESSDHVRSERGFADE